ncbi:hypothetical protein BAG01nite_48890 [Brevibacillus agri]|uniref:Uncharacterized protein n=2 Tax=Brevibacillus TaxID=55080 RepID=A0A3M8AKM8_9BACL|nr:hypothetical protein [Brevibacillus agri]QAV15721.1 hypothetical protein BA6348_24955 [Brevibacillus agri]QHZ58381.1 hypothetical protein M655_023560 [Brevibacillus sp. NSP2.1]RNB51752.1 hypothetical protein EB820_19505 [Brevibacillus agri]GED28787.1 hypothetical protein BAG01nite_48890 [Brevibacillus agri]
MKMHFQIEKQERLEQGKFFEFFKGKVDITCTWNGNEFVFSFFRAVDALDEFFSLLYLMESRGVKIKMENPDSVGTYYFELKDEQFVLDYFIFEDLVAHYEAPVPYHTFKKELVASLHAYLEELKKINPDITNHPIYQGLTRCQINREWFDHYCEMIADAYRRANREVPARDELFRHHIVKK